MLPGEPSKPAVTSASRPYAGRRLQRWPNCKEGPLRRRLSPFGWAIISEEYQHGPQTSPNTAPASVGRLPRRQDQFLNVSEPIFAKEHLVTDEERW